MWQYLKLHETFIRDVLEGKHEGDLEQLMLFHERQVRQMQHERLVHLIVTMFVATFMLLGLGFVTVRFSLPGVALVCLLLLLLAAYIIHYFRLENGVQRWYHLGNRIAARLGRFSASYQEGRVAVSRSDLTP